MTEMLRPFRIFFACVTFLTPLFLFPQDTTKFIRCATDEVWAAQMAAHPEWARLKRERDQQIRIKARTLMTYANKTAQVKYHVPVVVHVIHENGPENISDAQIRSQIDVLNEDYLKIAGSPGDGAGAIAGVEFYLARLDPEGNPTTGINRIYSPFTAHGPDPFDGSTTTDLMNLINWPPQNYMNIWLVKSMGSNNGSILGYSALLGPSMQNDGIVSLAKAFGRVGAVRPPSNLGRTITHEAGHWLSLYHPFDEGCLGATADNCETYGDHVCDTPQSAGPNYKCPSDTHAPNTCIDSPDDLPDDITNYMNYTDDECMNHFTFGQVGRMQAAIELFRSSIYSEQNLRNTGFYGPNRRPYDEATSFGMTLWPNPTNGGLSFTPTVDASARVSIYNFSGMLVQEIVTQPGEHSVSTAGLAAGVYVLSLAQNDKIHIAKFIKLP